MVLAVLICSGEGCTQVYEARGPLEEVDALACECGWGLSMVGWPDGTDEAGSSDALDRRLELVEVAA